MTLPVTFSAVADRQAEEVDMWWRANRLAAPSLFAQELQTTIGRLAETPFVGVRYARRRGRNIRRILLPGTRHNVFYIVGKRGVFILGVWSAIRGSGSKLGWIE